MPKITLRNQAAHRVANSWRGKTQTQITAVVNDQISRAHLEHGNAKVVALDYVAHLATALRENNIWPRR